MGFSSDLDSDKTNNGNRHLSALSVTPKLMYTLLHGWRGNDSIELPKLDWPIDAVFISANWEYERQTFFMVFEHPSFPEVKEGERIERVGPPIESIKLKYERNDNG